MGMEDGDARFGKVAYSCPNGHTFLSVEEAASTQGIEKLFGRGMNAM